jgi:PPM family protein phosphatase
MRRNPMSATVPEPPEPRSASITMDIEFAEATDCGPVRPHNEDYVGHSLPSSAEHARSRGWVFVLADGVGGRDRGEVASRLAVETVLSECATLSKGENSESLIERSIQTANHCVYEAGHGSIATTLVACALRFDRATVAHVGDSRCYLIRDGRLQRLTRDHTALADQARLGFFPDRESQRARLRSTLTRSLGTQLFVSPDITEHHVLPEDLLLLCSDGLHGAVPDSKIARIATSGAGLGEIAQQLIAIANESDGGDNVSVQLIRVKSVEAVGMYRGRPYRLH